MGFLEYAVMCGLANWQAAKILVNIPSSFANSVRTNPQLFQLELGYYNVGT